MKFYKNVLTKIMILIVFLVSGCFQGSSLVSSTNSSTSSGLNSSASNQEFVISRLNIFKLPNKMEYNENEKIDLTGGLIEVSYKDNNTKVVSMTAFNVVIASEKLNEAKNKTINLEYIENGLRYGLSFEVRLVDNLVPLNNTALDLNHIDLLVGQSFKLQYTIIPENSKVDRVEWISSSPSIASIDQDGIITAKSFGQGTITLIINSEFITTQSFKVLDNRQNYIGSPRRRSPFELPEGYIPISSEEDLEAINRLKYYDTLFDLGRTDSNDYTSYIFGTASNLSVTFSLDSGDDIYSQNFILTKDLDFSDYNYYLSSKLDLDNFGITWIPIGNNLNKFTGIFDGNNKTISNLVADLPGEDYVGLFGYVSGNYDDNTTVIKDFNLIDPIIIGNNYVGSFVGYLEFSELNNVEVISTGFYPSLPDSSDDYEDYIELIDILFTEQIPENKVSYVSGTSRVGGLVGRSVSSKIIDVKNETLIINDGLPGNYFGGIVGGNTMFYDVNIEDYIGESEIVSAENRGLIYLNNSIFVGGIAGGSGNFLEEYNPNIVIRESINFGEIVNLSRSASLFDGLESLVFAGGIVGANGGIIIASYNEGNIGFNDDFLAIIRSLEIIDNNIDLEEDDYYVYNSSFVGGIAGINYNGAKILNSSNFASVNANAYAGGIAGNNSGSIYASTNENKVVDSVQQKNAISTTMLGAGGIVGINLQGNLLEVSNNQQIYGSKIEIVDQFLEGSAGGLIGLSIQSQIRRSYNLGDVDGFVYLGGLIGFSLDSLIDQSFNEGNVGYDGYASDLQENFLAQNVGGLVGLQEENLNILNSYNVGNVYGSDYLGGFVGLSDTTDDEFIYITDSYVISEIIENPENEDGDGQNIGMLVGKIDSGDIIAVNTLYLVPNEYRLIGTQGVEFGPTELDYVIEISQDVDTPFNIEFANFTSVWVNNNDLYRPILSWKDNQDFSISIKGEGVVINNVAGPFNSDADVFKFDGTSNSFYSIENIDDLFNFKEEDFTVEWFSYQTSVDGYQRLFDIGNGAWSLTYELSEPDTVNVYYYSSSSTTLIKTYNKNDLINKWIHWAIVRKDGTITIYADGLNIWQDSDSNIYYFGVSPLVIGNYENHDRVASNEAFTGYISSFRMIKGLGLYTDVFARPTLDLIETDKTILLFKPSGLG
jgi:hypothetical protein